MTKRTPKLPTGATTQVGYPINWQTQGRLGEFIKPLSGMQGLIELERMVDEDETVGAMLFLINAAMARVEFQHVSCQNGQPVADNAKADKARDFADSLMLDMEVDWYDHLEEALTMIWAGFAPCEITLRQRIPETGSRFSDGFYGVRSLDLRDQRSISQYCYDPQTREFLGLRQVAMGGDMIPSWKLCNYRTSSVLKRPYGRSLLMNAYRVYRLKKKIQDAEAIGIERDLAGLPTFRMPQSVLDQASETEAGVATPAALTAQAKIQAAIRAVQDMRFNESGGLVLPSDPWSVSDEESDSNTPQYDFKITTTAGQRSIDARTAAQDHDRAIARLLALQFMQLGSRSSGSYGLSDDQSSMAIQALMAFALKVTRTYSKSVLPLVWSANGMDPQYLPKLQPKPLTKDQVQSIGAYLSGLAKVMPMIQDDPKARVQALRRAGIDADPAFQVNDLAPDPTDPADPADPPADPAPNPEDKP